MLCCLSCCCALTPNVPDCQTRYRALKWEVLFTKLGALYWERYIAFSTYLWEWLPSESSRSQAASLFSNCFSLLGAVISGICLEIRKWTPINEKADRSVSISSAGSTRWSREGGAAVIVTDFYYDSYDMTSILILDRGGG